ncbi:MAG: isopenicillin N synthase family oxygenase [Gammaproteobacteria bacterium]|nr:isopenicillin N synthase family oxygenase [Gammaproteobacteria bacterium]
MPHSQQKNQRSATPSIPAVDLQAFLRGDKTQQRRIAKEIDDVCKTIGFLIVENHGVPASIINGAWAEMRAFFDLPLSEKLKCRSDDPACPRGYFPIAAEALAKSLGVDTPPDLKESFGIGPLRAPPRTNDSKDYDFHFGENLWPDKPADLKDALVDYVNSMERLASQVLCVFAAALDLPQDFFQRYHSYPMCALRCINYPATVVPPARGQRGAGEHSDYGSITLLKSDPDVPGLEIKLASGEWVSAPLVDDAFIVNIGDLMARWTNDRWVSTLHRVTNPVSDSGQVTRRQSMAFFHNTNFDATIDCIPTCLAADEQAKYEPVLAGRYLIDRFTSAVNSTDVSE